MDLKKLIELIAEQAAREVVSTSRRISGAVKHTLKWCLDRCNQFRIDG